MAHVVTDSKGVAEYSITFREKKSVATAKHEISGATASVEFLVYPEVPYIFKFQMLETGKENVFTYTAKGEAWDYYDKPAITPIDQCLYRGLDLPDQITNSKGEFTNTITNTDRSEPTIVRSSMADYPLEGWRNRLTITPDAITQIFLPWRSDRDVHYNIPLNPQTSISKISETNGGNWIYVGCNQFYKTGVDNEVADAIVGSTYVICSSPIDAAINIEIRAEGRGSEEISIMAANRNMNFDFKGLEIASANNVYYVNRIFIPLDISVYNTGKQNAAIKLRITAVWTFEGTRYETSTVIEEVLLRGRG